MASRMVVARTERLPLTGGDWIEVRAELNHGEHNRMYERMYVAAPNGEPKRQPTRFANVLITAYLIDWSLVDQHDRVIPIRDLPPDEIEQRLDMLDETSVDEIWTAINNLHVRNAADRAEKKRTRTGADMSLAT